MKEEAGSSAKALGSERSGRRYREGDEESIHLGMNLRGVATALCVFAGAFIAPATAQLVHLSFDIGEARMLFHSIHAESPWNREGGFVTKLDLYYDAEAPLVGMRPGKNWWQAKVDVPAQKRSFLIARPVQEIERLENISGLRFAFRRNDAIAFEEFELTLIFDSPIATEGLLPIPPLPDLDVTELSRSQFGLFGGQTFFPVADVAEGFGGGQIYGILPVPEPSTYAIGALVLMGVVVAIRRRRCRGEASTCIA